MIFLEEQRFILSVYRDTTAIVNHSSMNEVNQVAREVEFNDISLTMSIHHPLPRKNILTHLQKDIKD